MSFSNQLLMALPQKTDCGNGNWWHVERWAGCAADWIGEHTVEEVKDSFLKTIADAITNGLTAIFKSIGSLWLNVKVNPNEGYNPQNGDVAGIGNSYANANVAIPGWFAPISQVLDYVFYIGLVLVILSLIFWAARFGFQQDSAREISTRAKWLFGGLLVLTCGSKLVNFLFDQIAFQTNNPIINFIVSRTWFLTITCAIVGCLVGGIQLAITQRGEAGHTLVKGIFQLVVVTGCSMTVIGLLTTAADQFSEWMIRESLSNCSGETNTCFAAGMARFIMGSGGGWAVILTIIIGLVYVLVSLVLMVLMIMRSALLMLAVAVLPITAAASTTKTGDSWFKRTVSMIAAMILFKPAASIIIAIGFRMTANLDEEPLIYAAQGLCLFACSLLALPALMKIISPMGVGGAMPAGIGTAAGVGVIATGALAFKGIKNAAKSFGSRTAPAAAGGGLASGASGASAGGGSSGGAATGGATGSGSATGSADGSKSADSSGGGSGQPGSGAGVASGADMNNTTTATTAAAASPPPAASGAAPSASGASSGGVGRAASVVDAVSGGNGDEEAPDGSGVS